MSLQQVTNDAHAAPKGRVDADRDADLTGGEARGAHAGTSIWSLAAQFSQYSA
jgi:hypothetical protein